MSIQTQITKMAYQVAGKLKRYSPEILVVSGIIGAGVSVVTACKATVKATEIINNKDEEIRNVEYCLEHEDTYDEEMAKQDRKTIMSVTILGLVKTYAPTALIFTASAFSIFKSHDILKKRNVALASAYALLDGAFKDYREKIIAEFGEDFDKKLRYTSVIKEEKTDENGNVTVEEKTVYNDHSPYAKVWYELYDYCQKDPEANMEYLKRQQNYANERLEARGHLFLNEVYDMLNLPRTKIGQTHGWIATKEKGGKDCYVDFGLYDIHNPDTRAFINGEDFAVLLDFNCDGYIVDKI